MTWGNNPLIGYHLKVFSQAILLINLIALLELNIYRRAITLKLRFYQRVHQKL